MDSIIQTFHIDVKLLIAQIINFAIVFAVLYKFALKPLQKVMEERSEKIEKSLENAKIIDGKLTKAEEEYNKTISKARKEANEILNNANEQAQKNKEETITKTKEEIGIIINKEKEAIRKEKENILHDIRKEASELVILAAEKLLNKKLENNQEDKDFIKKELNG